MKKFLCMVMCVILLSSCTTQPRLSQEDVLDDARISQKIDENWLVKNVKSDEMVAMLFYSEDQTAHTFSIYLNDDSYGYLFASGGSLLVYDDEVQCYTFDDVSYQAFISMNQAQICQYEINNNCKVQKYTMDSSQPFVIVLPIDCGDVTFITMDGERIVAK